jgi:hypothetical protein
MPPHAELELSETPSSASNHGPLPKLNPAHQRPIGSSLTEARDAHPVTRDFQRYCLLCSPLLIEHGARAEEIYFGLEGTFEAVFSSLQRGQDWEITRLERVGAGREYVGQLSLIHEERALALANNELRAKLDLIRIAWEAIDEVIR